MLFQMRGVIVKKSKLLFKLFLSTLCLSAFTFGGGYVIVTLMKKKFADEYKWIDEKEMLDLVAIAQSAPGPIAVNGAIVIGYKLAGFLGAIVAIVATVIPPFVIISVVSLVYQAFIENFIVSKMLEGMQAGVGAVIASVVYDMVLDVFKMKSRESVVVMILAFVACVVFNVNVVFIVIICALLGVFHALYNKRKEKKQ